MSNTHALSPRVLVIRGAAIGDFIVTLPAMRLLKESIPGCRLDVLGDPGISALAKVAGIADDTWNLDHRSMAPLFAPGAAIDPAVVERLTSYNVVVSYLFDPDGIFRGNLERLGVKTFIECPHRVLDGLGPAPAQLARPLEKLAMFLEDPAPRISIPNADGPVERVILHPGSGSLKKNWGLDNWREILERVADAFPKLELVVVTGEAEAERGVTQEIGAGWTALRFTHWDQHSLEVLATARFPSKRACFLGHDSGISHLAAACGLPCFLLFGPTDPSVWAPTHPGVEVFHRPDESLAELTVDAVWQKLNPWLLELLKESPEGL